MVATIGVMSVCGMQDQLQRQKTAENRSTGHSWRWGRCCRRGLLGSCIIKLVMPAPISQTRDDRRRATTRSVAAQSRRHPCQMQRGVRELPAARPVAEQALSQVHGCRVCRQAGLPPGGGGGGAGAAFFAPAPFKPREAGWGKLAGCRASAAAGMLVMPASA